MPAEEPVKDNPTTFQKIVRRAVKATSIAIGIVALLWVLLFSYFRLHKKEILQKTIGAIQKNVSGTVTITDIGLDFPSTFPYLSVELENIVIRDSLYQAHHHDLLRAKSFYLQVNPLSLLKGAFTISQIMAENGSVYIYEDANGYSNQEAVKQNKADSGKKNRQVDITGFRLVNMRVVFDKRFKNKLYDFDIKNLSCAIHSNGDNDRCRVKTNMLVNTLAFNLQKGSFAQRQPLSGNFIVNYNKPSGTLNLDDIVLQIGGDPYHFTGKFNLKGEKFFHLEITTGRAKFDKVARLLPYAIQKNIDSIHLSKTLDTKAVIDGRFVYGYKAVVRVDWSVKNTSVTTPFGAFENASFSGFFFNHLSDTAIAKPENSILQINNFTCRWEGLALESDTIAVANLKYPVLNCDLRASADLTALNDIIATETFEFNKGTLKADVVYRGAIYDSATTAPNINGYVKIKDGWLVYGPRQIQLEQFNGDLIFSGTDVYFKNITALAQGNKIQMNIKGTNLLTIINSDPSKATLEATVHSPEIDISKFTSFVGGRQKMKRKTKGGGRFRSAASRIDKLLDQCSIISAISADKIKLKKFTASDLKTNILLTNQVWALRNTSFKHAGGEITLDGALRNGTKDYNPVNLTATLSNIDISKLFYAFNNFKLSSLNSKNLQGKLNSQINLSGALLEKADLVPSSLKGAITLSLKEGELNNFEPLESMSNFLLKNRDFSHISFSEIKNRFDFNGSHVYINRMEIQSNVLSLFMEGLYDISGKETDLQIQVPLSNLKKRKPDYIPEKKGVNSNAGVSVYVNAKSNDKGDINFSYGLFHKKIKK